MAPYAIPQAKHACDIDEQPRQKGDIAAASYLKSSFQQVSPIKYWSTISSPLDQISVDLLEAFGYGPK